jgi:MFS family permease
VLAGFVAWERRVVRAGHAPIFDVRLVTETRGYGIGAALATLYFLGFSGIWIVFALFFQNGLDFSPLGSGLAVTPFALGSVVAAVVAGRLVERFGRGLTVAGLALVMLGLGAAAVVLVTVPPEAVGWAMAPALLVGGLGGGSVISPNVTMTLRDVPVHMAGAAGGGLQTAQRFGNAVGTAALPGLFYVVLRASGDDFPLATAVALGAAVVGVGGALVLAVVDWRRDRREPAATAQQRDPDRAPAARA